VSQLGWGLGYGKDGRRGGVKHVHRLQFERECPAFSIVEL
jgi:hypothetical protein